MQSLEKLTAEKIISLLPQACIDILVETYLKEDKIYNLATFVEVDDSTVLEHWDKYWYFTFSKDRFIGASSCIPNKPYYSNDEVCIYCLPRSGYTNIFYSRDASITKTSIIYSTHHELTYIQYTWSWWNMSTPIRKNSRGDILKDDPITARYFIVG